MPTGEGQPSWKRLRSTFSWLFAGAVQSAPPILELPGQSTWENAWPSSPSCSPGTVVHWAAEVGGVTTQESFAVAHGATASAGGP